MERFIGVDLAWAQRTGGVADNETGLVALDADGNVVDANWVCGVPKVVSWINSAATASGLLFVDAPLVINNPTGQRLCETQVGQRYGDRKVSANSTNMTTKNRAGVDLLNQLQESGWTYHSGLNGAPRGGLRVSECYPYTTLVGTAELSYHQSERPKYKRRPKGMRVAAWRLQRAANCDELIRRLDGLATADPPLRLASHELTRKLRAEPSPWRDVDYKHREDLIDAVIAAWTALLWYRHGFDRCQVLGPDQPKDGLVPTIIAPAMPEQRRPRRSSETIHPDRE